MSPYSGVVYEGGYDEDFIVETCSHEHKTAKAARECGEAMAAGRKKPVLIRGVEAR